MSYQPTNWKAGDTVTSAKLNKMEQGIENASNKSIVFVEVNSQNEGYILNKTWQEIFNLAKNNLIYSRVVVDENEPSDGNENSFIAITPIITIYHNDGDYTVDTFDYINRREVSFSTNSPDGYPYNDGK